MMDATKTMVQAFINSRLDSCNALYYGISDELMGRLQSVQNAAARLITGTRRCDHITPVLRHACSPVAVWALPELLG